MQINWPLTQKLLLHHDCRRTTDKTSIFEKKILTGWAAFDVFLEKVIPWNWLENFFFLFFLIS